MTNPFLTQEWQETWYQFGGNKRKLIQFSKNKEQMGIMLINRFIPLYVNSGRNYTNTMETSHADYFISNIKGSVQRGVALFFDVPQGGELAQVLKRNGANTVELYPGFVTNIEAPFETYYRKQFNSKRRAELAKFNKRLSLLGQLKFDIYDDQSDLPTVLSLVNSFYRILNERYKSKKEYNRNLTDKGWNFIEELIQATLGKGMILSVTSLDGHPISFAISYRFSDTIIYSMAGFDISFTRYNLGNVHLMKLIEWCTNNGFRKFDFSKGQGVYKDKWANTAYVLNLYILPLGTGLKDKITSQFLFLYYQLISNARRNGISRIVKQFKHKIMTKKTDTDLPIERISVRNIVDKQVPFSYSDISYMPMTLKRDMLNVIYDLLAESEKIYISKANSNAIFLSNSLTTVGWRI